MGPHHGHERLALPFPVPTVARSRKGCRFGTSQQGSIGGIAVDDRREGAYISEIVEKADFRCRVQNVHLATGARRDDGEAG